MKTVLEVALELAAAHRNEDPETQEVYVAEAQDEVRLVEVSTSLAASGEVLPFRFKARPDKGVPYPSVIVLLNPEDWAAVRAGKLPMPFGWGAPTDLKKIA
jgi:hypothetical protein